MSSNIAYEAWKAAGMVYNRYRRVLANRNLMKKVDADDFDMEGVKAVLKELINASLPVSSEELEVIKRIEAGEVSALAEFSAARDKPPGF